MTRGFKMMDLITEQGLRMDGRKVYELRKIHCKLGVFSQPEGSAYLEQGNTKVLAAVYGPHQIKGSRSKPSHEFAIINCQYSMATFSTAERKKRPRGDVKSTEITIHLKQAMQASIKTELYPYSQIDIFLEVLQADGSNYCTCVNAATLALIDAGIPLREFVVACSASLGNYNTPLIDVSHVEESMGGSNLTVAALPLSGQIVVLEMSQKFHIDHLSKVLNEAMNGCRQIHEVLNAAVKLYLNKMGAISGWGKLEF